MRLQPASDLSAVPPTPVPSTEPKVAVLLNANARKVTEKVVHKLSHVVPEGDLYVSRSELDARRISQTVIEKGYHTVFCGGGDGTFMGFANEILHQVELRAKYLPVQPPRFGILKLGTGNGMATLVNASAPKKDRILDDVLRARASEVPGYRRLDLLEVEGKRAQFAGMGIDGKILNDYLGFKNLFGGGPFQQLASGGMGYFGSVTLKSLPYYLTRPIWSQCEVINGGHEAYLLNSEGKPVKTMAPGEVLFRGKLMMAAAATIPFYGFEFRMFPFAGRQPGMMQLRLAAVTAVEVVTNLRKLWTGRWFPGEKVLDFHAREVTIRGAKPMPFQIAGDAAGYREEIHFGMAKEQLELVDFTGAVN